MNTINKNYYYIVFKTKYLLSNVNSMIEIRVVYTYNEFIWI